MGNKDIISKSVLQHLAGDIANLLLGLDVDKDSVQLLETEKGRVELRRADMVARMRSNADGEPFILHVEIQNANDKTMPLRMLRYLTDIQMVYPDEPIRQYLVYIGSRKLTMPEELVQVQFTYRYTILDMSTVDCAMLLAMDNPDALVLAVLCDFKRQPAQDVINYIVKRLKELTGDDEAKFRNYFKMLETLGDNRDLQANLDEAKAMLTEVDVKKFASYNWGLRAGVEQGIEKGDIKRALSVAKKLLQKNQMSHEDIADITSLSIAQVEALSRDLMN